jgi:N-acyl-D-amino-acid deacylase
VVDGSGGDPLPGAVRVRADGTIGEVATDLRADAGERVVDAAGLVLAPGFVDLHSHSDLYSLVRDGTGAPIGDQPKLLQGCTTQVYGQDGISAAPVRDDDVSAYAPAIAGLDGELDAGQWTWRSFADHLHALRATSATRPIGLVGHSTIRRYVMGTEARPATATELDAMRAAIAQSMQEGAAGVSTGLVYVPAAYADTAELLALCEETAAHDAPFFVHVRSESDGVLEATEEVLEVARLTGVHLHYSHLKTAGRANWAKAGALFEMIDDYRRRGVQVTADAHPYIAGSTTAQVLLPPWALDGGTDAALDRLRDATARARIREQLLGDTTTWDNWFAFSDGWPGLRVSGAKRPGAVGRSFAEVIQDAGVADLDAPEAFDVVFDLLLEERLNVSLVSFNNCEANVARVLGQPYVSVCTDGLVNPNGTPHPRLYGTFARVLGHFVRELGALTLPEAVRAMTARAAAAISRPDLGRVEPGAAADLVLFDPDTIADRATFEAPRAAPIGISGVWVAGRRVTTDGVVAETVLPAEPDGPQPAAPPRRRSRPGSPNAMS